MRSIKRLSFALIALGLSAPAIADNTLYVPSQHGGFKVAVDPLYLRKNDVSNLGESTYDWGTYAQIGYLFPFTGNDLTVNYTYLRSGDKDSLNVDDANLEIGQRLTSGAFDMHLFSGIRYSHLNYELNKSTADKKESLINLFHGFGPRMGIDTRYQLGNCFGLDTHVNTALLVGSLSTRYQGQERAISQTVNQLVPQLDAKIGIDYTYPVSSNSNNKSLFGIEVGYETSNYFHTFNGDMLNGVRDANFDGVYVDVKYYS